MTDLHTHSTSSDGDLAPTELVDLAVSTGLTVLALTDHDTLDGLDDAQSHAGKQHLTFVRGVELAVQFSPGDFHLLGLGLKQHQSATMEQFLSRIRENRTIRNREMLQAMNRDGISASMADLEVLARGKVIARPHFAQWLVNSGHCRSWQEAFSRWIGPSCPWYVPRTLPTLEESTDIIHEAGGKAVMAHPVTLRVDTHELEQLLPRFRDQGLDGLEAWHSGVNKNTAQKFESIARRHTLLVTGGSDFHSRTWKDRTLGRGAGGTVLDSQMAQPFL